MSAPAHTTLSVQQFLTKNDMTPMSHPPYSPALTRNTIFWFVCLFPRMKNVLKEKRFTDVEEVEQKMAEALEGINVNKLKTVSRSGKTLLIDVLH